MGYYDGFYFLIIIISLVLGFATQGYINSAYRKWSKVPVASGFTGAQAARVMLDSEGLQHVAIERIAGKLSDHFDPRANVLRLSQDVYDGVSVASTAIACHEAGHAVQHAKSYLPAKLRGALVPVVNFGSNAWIFLLMIGLVLNLTGLVTLAIVFFSFAVVFQIVTLPVEFDASARALRGFALQSGPAGSIEHDGAKSVLRAAALTYVAAALVSVLQLLHLIGVARRN